MNNNLNEQAKQIANNVLTKEKKSNAVTLSDKFDRIITNPFLGFPLFFLIIFVVFYLSLYLIGPVIADLLVEYIEQFAEFMDGTLSDAGANELITGFIVEAIILGVGAVVSFVPLVLVLYFFLAILEETGYLSRVVLLFDRQLRKIGLSGKSIVPLISCSGCTVPGIMATRTVKDPKKRRQTILLAPFVPCGAKLPVIAFFASIYFSDSIMLLMSIYLIAFLVIILVGLLVKVVTRSNQADSHLLIELPEYKVPGFGRVFRVVLEQAKHFIIKASTIIVVANGLIWLLSSFTFTFAVANDTASDSILAVISTPVAFLLIPLGFGVWQFTAAAISGFVAKENVVSTLAVVFAVSTSVNEDFEALNNDVLANAFNLTNAAAVAFLLFCLFTPPCFAAISAMRSEIDNKKYFRYTILLHVFTAYLVALLTYQIGTIIESGAVSSTFVVGLIITLVYVAFIFYLTTKYKNEELTHAE